MARANINDLIAFLTVAGERGLPPRRLGVSQSALSHTLRGLPRLSFAL